MKLAKNDRGVTLLEVLLASAILGILVLAVVQLSGYNMLATHKSDRMTQAQRSADQVMNKIRADAISGTVTSGFPANTPSVTCTDITLPCDNYLPLNSHMTMTVRRQSFSGTSNVTMSPDPSSRQVHVQAIVLQGGFPQLVTVSVTWEERR